MVQALHTARRRFCALLALCMNAGVSPAHAPSTPPPRARLPRINVKLTPFIDTGKVFAGTHVSPLSRIHRLAGLGFRGITPPCVVGYVDVGYESKGAAVSTGINYPF